MNFIRWSLSIISIRAQHPSSNDSLQPLNYEWTFQCRNLAVDISRFSPCPYWSLFIAQHAPILPS